MSKKPISKRKLVEATVAVRHNEYVQNARKAKELLLELKKVLLQKVMGMMNSISVRPDSISCSVEGYCEKGGNQLPIVRVEFFMEADNDFAELLDKASELRHQTYVPELAAIKREIVRKVFRTTPEKLRKVRYNIDPLEIANNPNFIKLVNSLLNFKVDIPPVEEVRTTLPTTCEKCGASIPSSTLLHGTKAFTKCPTCENFQNLEVTEPTDVKPSE